MKRLLKKLLAAICCFYLVLCAGMWGMQRNIIFQPLADTAMKEPLHYGLTGFTQHTIKTADDETLTAWYSKAKANYPTLVYFHGNGGNMIGRAEFFQALAISGLGVLAIDYRGYGSSSGTPSEQGFYRDGRATLDYAQRELKLPLSDIVLYGESIGSGIAVQMGTEYQVAAVILQSPFTSIAVLGKRHYYWLPVDMLLTERFDSLSKIALVKAKLLIMHGARDTIVPVDEGRTLFAKANEPKEELYFPESGHNDMGVAARVNSVLMFLKKPTFFK